MFGGNSPHHLIAEAHLASVLVRSFPKHVVQNWYLNYALRGAPEEG